MLVYHKVNLKDIDQTEFLYNFFLSKGDNVAAELLQYDTLVSYRGKVRSEAVGLPKQTKELLQEGESILAQRRDCLSVYSKLYLQRMAQDSPTIRGNANV